MKPDRYKKQKSGVLGGALLPMGLICLFAFCSLALALIGGQAYRNIDTRIADNFSSHVVSNYLRTKLLQNNEADSVSLRMQNGTTILVIKSTLGEIDYETRIFAMEHALFETMTAAEAEFDPAGANKIADIRDLSFSISDDGLLLVQIENLSGQRTRSAFALITGGIS